MDSFDVVSHPIEFDHCSGDPTQKVSLNLNQCMDDQSNGAVKSSDNAVKCVRKLEENANISNDLLSMNGGVATSSRVSDTSLKKSQRRTVQDDEY